VRAVPSVSAQGSVGLCGRGLDRPQRMRKSLGRSDDVGDLMNCLRCGTAEVVPEPVFIVSHGGEPPELTRAIDGALKAQGIGGVEAMGQLCQPCSEVATACIQEGARVYAAAHRDLVLQQYEANAGRALTAAERQEIEAYLGRPTQRPGP
jgi:hypothetical protein